MMTSKWFRQITGPCVFDDTADTGDHLSSEDLAVLAEGRAPKDRRQEMVGHINRCGYCYEIFQSVLSSMDGEIAVRHPDGESSRQRTDKRRRLLITLAASVFLVSVLSTVTYFNFFRQPVVITASVDLDGELRDLLMEDESLVWKDQRVERLTKLLEKRGIKIKSIKKVVLTAPYVAKKDIRQILFGPEEVLDIKISDGVAHIQVVLKPKKSE